MISSFALENWDEMTRSLPVSKTKFTLSPFINHVWDNGGISAGIERIFFDQQQQQQEGQQVRHRILYDSEWLNNGCKPIEDYDSKRNYDDTVGTYVTDYIVGLLLFIVAYYLYRCNKKIKEEIEQQRQQQRQERQRNDDVDMNREVSMTASTSSASFSSSSTSLLISTYRIYYFILSGIGFTIGGIGHQFVHSIEPKWVLLSVGIPTFFFGVMGYISLTFEIIHVQYPTANTDADADEDATDENKKRRLFWMMMVLGVFGVCTIVALLLVHPIPLALYVLCLLIYVTVFWLRIHPRQQRQRQPDRENQGQQQHQETEDASTDVIHITTTTTTKQSTTRRNVNRRSSPNLMIPYFGIGTLVIIIGLIVVVILAPICGDDSYKDCFELCPLPYQFNHNAVYHTITMIGIIIQAFGSAGKNKCKLK